MEKNIPFPMSCFIYSLYLVLVPSKRSFQVGRLLLNGGSIIFFSIQAHCIQNHQAKQRSPITCDLHSTFLPSLATVNDAQRFFSPQGSEPCPKLICKRQLPCSVYLVSSKCPLGSMNAIICLSAKK